MDEFMERLKRYASHPMWLSEETTQYVYNFPLPLPQEGQSLIEVGRDLAKKGSIPEEHLRQIGPFLTYLSPLSHIGPFLHAQDFLVPDGTDVLAALDGEIIEVVEHHDTWGNDPAFMGHLNYVTIRHAGLLALEFSQYCHLEKESVSRLGLSVGSRVKAGLPVAKVGKTGWTETDHLHMIVIRGDWESDDNPNPFGFRSLKIRFCDL